VRRPSESMVGRFKWVVLSAGIVFLSVLSAGPACAQDEEPVSEPEVTCEVLIDPEASIVPGMPPFAVLGLNLIENNEEVTTSYLRQIDVVILTDLVDQAPGDLDEAEVRDWVKDRLPEIEIWADGQPQGDDDNGTFGYSIEPGRLDYADRPLRAWPEPNAEVAYVNPQHGGMYILPRDPLTCGDPTLCYYDGNNAPCCSTDVDTVFRLMQGTGLTPLIYRFEFTPGQPDGSAIYLRPDQDQYSGNDIFVVVKLSQLWPTDASLTAVMFGQIASNPPVIPTEYGGGVDTNPPWVDEDGITLFEGCVPDEIQTPGLPFSVAAVQYASHVTIPGTPYTVPAEMERPRPDAASGEGWFYGYSRPQVVPMETPTSVIQIWAAGGDPSEDPWFVDRVTVTFTDMGGGGQFGRLEEETFRGDGGFNPLTGLDSFSGRPVGFRGVEFWRDDNNNGQFDFDGDACYVSDPNIFAVVPGDPTAPPVLLNDFVSTFPYVYVRYEPDPFTGVERSPEWTICLNIGRARKPSTVTPSSLIENMTADNIANFAMEADPETPEDLPDFFVVIRTDSGYRDTIEALVGDGTAIEYGVDFRAYIRPEIITDNGKAGRPLDYLNSLAREAAAASGVEPGPSDTWTTDDYQFPGGVLFSIQNVGVGGSDASPEITLDDDDATVLNALADIADLVVEYPSLSTFAQASLYETVPFFQTADLPTAAGPRSEFYQTPPLFIGPNVGTISDFGYYPIQSGLLDDPPDISVPSLVMDVERNYFTDRYGHRKFSQRIDSTSGERWNTTDTVPVPVLAINVAGTTDETVTTYAQFYLNQIDLFFLSTDYRGVDTGFEPTDLLAVSPTGLGPSGISIWLDNPNEGVFGLLDESDTQVELTDFYISTVKEAVEMDGIHQDRDGDGILDPEEIYGIDTDGDGLADAGLDAVGYRVTVRPVQPIQVPPDDIDDVVYAGSTAGNYGSDDLFVCIETSDTISYKDRIEVVMPGGFGPAPDGVFNGLRRHGLHFLPQDVSSPSVTVRAEPYLGTPRSVARPLDPLTPWVLPTEYLPFDRDAIEDERRVHSVTQLRTNVPVELHSLIEMEDTNGDFILDPQPLRKNSGTVPVLGIDTATLNAETEVYLEQLVVEFYNQGDDNDFDPLTDLMPMTTHSDDTDLDGDGVIDVHGSGVGLWRDRRSTDPDWDLYADLTTQGQWDEWDFPLVFDDPPDLIGAVGEPQIQVRMVFSSPGTDGESPENPFTDGPEPPESLYGETLRQRVPDTFGRNEFGVLDPAGPNGADAGIDFFVTIRTSSDIEAGDDFTVGIFSWGPDTPTAPDPDQFTAPPAPIQPADEYEIFQEFAFGSRAIGFIEILPDGSDLSGFDFFRTRSLERIESDPLIAIQEGGSGGQLSITGVYPTTLAQVTPASGPQIVVIEGTGFAAGVVVTIDGVTLQVLSVAGTEIIAAVPPTSELTDGTVTVTLGVDQVTWNQQIALRSGTPPTISSVTPPSGPSGIDVLIVGNNFEDDVEVAFGDTAAGAGFIAPATVDSPTRITATVPVGPPPGPLFVRVTNTSSGLMGISAPVPDGQGGYDGGFLLQAGQAQLPPAEAPPTLEGESLIVADECVLPNSVEIPLMGINTSFNPVGADGNPLNVDEVITTIVIDIVGPSNDDGDFFSAIQYTGEIEDVTLWTDRFTGNEDLDNLWDPNDIELERLPGSDGIVSGFGTIRYVFQGLNIPVPFNDEEPYDGIDFIITMRTTDLFGEAFYFAARGGRGFSAVLQTVQLSPYLPEDVEVPLVETEDDYLSSFGVFDATPHAQAEDFGTFPAHFYTGWADELVHNYTLPDEFWRPRYDNIGEPPPIQRTWNLGMGLPTCVPLETHYAVVGIDAHAGQNEDGQRVFLNEVTIAFQDLGADPDGPAGNGGFNPLEGFDPAYWAFNPGLPSEPGFMDVVFGGITIYRDSDNNGQFDAPTVAEGTGDVSIADLPYGLVPVIGDEEGGYVWEYLPDPYPDIVGEPPEWRVTLYPNVVREANVQPEAYAVEPDIDGNGQNPAGRVIDFWVVIKPDSGFRDGSG